MAENKSTSLIRAAGYLRRSTEKQEKSLADQRSEIERYAKANGYEVIRWYEDDGISGDDTERRRGFLEMHKAATNGRDFDTILVWDQDRFGRFNSLEAGFWIHPLMKAGIRLVTVAEGPVNWTDFTGRVMYSLKQEGKHQFLLDLSRNATRGMISTAKAGFMNGGRACYGLDKMLLNERGEHVQRVHEGEQYAKPKGWKVTLVPSDDPKKVEVVRWLFDTYFNRSVGLRGLANDLNKRNIPSPTGGKWHADSIRRILTNPAYVGDKAYGRRTCGKYHRVTKDEARPRQGNGTIRNPAEMWIVRQDAHEGIIDRETFRAVQEKFAERKDMKTPKSKQDAYLLTGLLVCGNCGNKMHGASRGRDPLKYECSGYVKHGLASGCGCHTVKQAPVVKLLVSMLRDEVLTHHREDLKDRILDQLRARQKAKPNLAALEKRLAKLDGDVDRAAERLLRADEDLVDLLGPKVTAMRAERQKLAQKLQEARQCVPEGDLEAKAEEVVGRLWTLVEDIDKADPARVREVIHRMVSRIVFYFGREKKGKRTVYRVQRGIIELRPDPILSGLMSRDDDHGLPTPAVSRPG